MSLYSTIRQKRLSVIIHPADHLQVDLQLYSGNQASFCFPVILLVSYLGKNNL
jgi:hypothetical protein